MRWGADGTAAVLPWGCDATTSQDGAGDGRLRAVEIRDATSGDAARVAELLTALGYTSAPGELCERLDALGDADRVLIAGDCAGLVALHRVPNLPEGGSFTRITALVVAPRRRRNGVARALLDAAERAARDWGSAFLEVSSGRRPERDAAHRLYQASGFRDTEPHSVRYRKPLGPPD